MYFASAHSPSKLIERNHFAIPVFKTSHFVDNLRGAHVQRAGVSVQLIVCVIDEWQGTLRTDKRGTLRTGNTHPCIDPDFRYFSGGLVDYAFGCWDVAHYERGINDADIRGIKISDCGNVSSQICAFTRTVRKMLNIEPPNPGISTTTMPYHKMSLDCGNYLRKGFPSLRKDQPSCHAKCPFGGIRA